MERQADEHERLIGKAMSMSATPTRQRMLGEASKKKDKAGNVQQPELYRLATSSDPKDRETYKTVLAARGHRLHEDSLNPEYMDKILGQEAREARSLLVANEDWMNNGIKRVNGGMAFAKNDHFSRNVFNCYQSHPCRLMF